MRNLRLIPSGLSALLFGASAQAGAANGGSSSKAASTGRRPSAPSSAPRSTCSFLIHHASDRPQPETSGG